MWMTSISFGPWRDWRETCRQKVFAPVRENAAVANKHAVDIVFEHLPALRQWNGVLILYLLERLKG